MKTGNYSLRNKKGKLQEEVLYENHCFFRCFEFFIDYTDSKLNNISNKLFKRLFYYMI